MKKLMLALLLLIVWMWHAHAEHFPNLAWMKGTKAADGSSCCGISDCTRAHAKLMEEPTGDYVRVYVEAITPSYFSMDYQPIGVEMTLPVRSVHRSMETHDLWCFRNWGDVPEVREETTRCLFISVGN